MVNHEDCSGVFSGPGRRHLEGAADALGIRSHVAEAVAPRCVIVG